jgi:single-strand DNA-binding protein
MGIYLDMGAGGHSAEIGKADTGDLVRVTGRVRKSSYEAEGATRYRVDLLAYGFAILAKANGRPTEDERR